MGSRKDWWTWSWEILMFVLLSILLTQDIIADSYVSECDHSREDKPNGMGPWLNSLDLGKAVMSGKLGLCVGLGRGERCIQSLCDCLREAGSISSMFNSHWLKRLCHRCEDQSSDPKHPCKSLAEGHVSIRLALNSVGRKRWILGACWPARLVQKLQVPREILFQKKMENGRGRHRMLSSGFTSNTPFPACKHTNIHSPSPSQYVWVISHHTPWAVERLIAWP